MTIIRLKVTNPTERQNAVMSLLCAGKKVWIENENEICYEDESTVIRYIPYYDPPITTPSWPYYPIITYTTSDKTVYTTSDKTSSGTK